MCVFTHSAIALLKKKNCCPKLDRSVELEVNRITLGLLGLKHQLLPLKHCLHTQWAFAPFGSDAVPEGPSIGCGVEVQSMLGCN